MLCYYLALLRSAIYSRPVSDGITHRVPLGIGSIYLEPPTVDLETMTPNTEVDAISTSIATRGRHRPGSACDECRRRKLRCDGQQPQCGVCQESGVVCEVTQRGARGPKKGYLKALRNRVLHLETMLESRLAAGQQPPQRGTGSSSEITLPTPPLQLSDTTAVDHAQSWLPAATTSASEPEKPLSSSSLPDLGSLSGGSLTSTLPLVSNADLHMTAVVQAEL